MEGHPSGLQKKKLFKIQKQFAVFSVEAAFVAGALLWTKSYITFIHLLVTSQALEQGNE